MNLGPVEILHILGGNELLLVLVRNEFFLMQPKELVECLQTFSSQVGSG